MMNLRLAGLVVATSLVPAAISQNTLYETRFDDATGWTLQSSDAVFTVDSGLPPTVTGHPSGSTALRFTETGYFNPGGWEWGRGTATSIPIDLTGSPDPAISFWLAWHHETGCDWDELSLIILSEVGTELYRECLTDTQQTGYHAWEHVRRELDPSWGRVRIRFFYDAWDWVNVDDWGFVIDDVHVVADGRISTTLCEPHDQVNGSPGGRLRTGDQPTPTTTNLRVLGDSFPAHGYAAAFIGPDTAILPAGRGVRCIAANSQRLSVSPTRATGTPRWTIDLTDPGLAGMAQVGMPLYVQAYYRDGGSFNFSEAIRIEVSQ